VEEEAVDKLEAQPRFEDQAETRLITERLNQLISTVHPPHRGPYSMPEISARAAQLGYSLSSNYLYELRRGGKVNPTLKALFAIAAVFDVGIGYFFSQRDGVQAQTDLALARALNDPSVRDIALNAAALSPATREAAIAMLQQLQQLERRLGQDPEATLGAGLATGTNGLTPHLSTHPVHTVHPVSEPA
jgi:transcriptional regulator with XRE-family HTH domain